MITQLADWIKASVFALIDLRWSFKGSSVYNTYPKAIQMIPGTLSSEVIG
jgi:hypothetical protein